MRLGFDLFKLDPNLYVTHGIYAVTCMVCSGKKKGCGLICRQKYRRVHAVLSERGAKNSKKERRKLKKKG